MAQAKWQGAVLAESAQTIEVEGNQYFPLESVHREFIEPSDYHTTCGWKGVASYFHVIVAGEKNANAAWFYPEPLPAAKQIKGYVAFWRGVRVET